MKTELLNRCRSLESEIQDESHQTANCSIAAAEKHLNILLDSLEAGELAEQIKQGIHVLALRARVNRLRCETLADHIGEEAKVITDGINHRMRDIRVQVEGMSEYDEAAIAIEREMHEAKGTFKEMLQSLLMWVETPEERVRREREALN